MAFISWFQRKALLFLVAGIVVVVILFKTLCNVEKQGHYPLLESTQDEIQRLRLRMHGIMEENGLTQIDEGLPTLYLITPTYSRYTQQADLIRMSNTLKHVPNLHWIIVEDSDHMTTLVASLLRESKLEYTHLNVRTQRNLVKSKDDPRWKKHRGVDQRNHGLQWIRKNIDMSAKGVVYFADDDNTYHIDLFKEMRWTKKISIWPVALVGGLRWEGPVCAHGKVIKFYTAWMPSRKYPVDMAAFAINVKLLFEYREAFINPEVKRGWLETDFLQQFKLDLDDLEAKANNCMKILVWHTQTADPKMKEEIKLEKLTGKGSDPRIII